jgi:hypothetical protein
MTLPWSNSLTQGYVSRFNFCSFFSFTYWFVVAWWKMGNLDRPGYGGTMAIHVIFHSTLTLLPLTNIMFSSSQIRLMRRWHFPQPDTHRRFRARCSPKSRTGRSMITSSLFYPVNALRECPFSYLSPSSPARPLPNSPSFLQRLYIAQ